MLFNQGLSALPVLSNARTRSISAENPQGLKGAGGQYTNHLGIGRKGRPCITLPQGETTVLADIAGPGVVQHIWITCTDRTPGLGDNHRHVLRDLVIRMYWDGEETPSVEAPLGDFFCQGHALRTVVNSLPIVVNPTGGMNSYFPMPFRRGCRIEVENQHCLPIEGFFYQITWAEVDSLPEETAYFHAQWRRENPTVLGQDFTILDGVRGRGHYVGTFLSWAALQRHWWGEGEIKFFMDGDTDWPTICGTGTEDYVGGAWCFGATYSTPFLGYTQHQTTTDMLPLNGSPNDCVPLHGMYRFHLPDPIRFTEDLRVTIQVIGHDHKQLFERSDDVSSVAYWYQTEPHTAFPKLIAPAARWPR